MRIGIREHLLALVVGGLVSAGCVPNDTATKPKQNSQPASTAKKRSAPKATTKRTSQAKGAGATPAQARRDPVLKSKFEDDFERDSLGSSWRPMKGVWKIEGGQLCGSRARNHPVWLARRLPLNVRIEFDATSHSPDGDLKVEVFGNGFGAATSASYNNASSYLAIFGGWKNRFHVLARLDEHAKDRPQLRLSADATDPRLKPVQPNQSYRFEIERSDGRTLRWLVDGVELFSYTDKVPLAGPGHDHFGFNDWDVRVCFDNLVIVPLEA